MWYICMANMCLYIVRLGIIFWAPMFLCELKHMSLSQAGWQVAAYEILGLFGAISAGWISDNLFRGQRGPVGFVFMVALALVLIVFWLIPDQYEIIGVCTMALAGFFVYGPQVLIGVASADLTSKQAIGTANGFASVFANVGSALAGVCVGWIVDNIGWDGVFIFFILSAVMGAIFFSLTWYDSLKKQSK
jgi:OPA family glycerol-3-phosphate transporter-like MFS transporter